MASGVRVRREARREEEHGLIETEIALSVRDNHLDWKSSGMRLF